MARRYRQIGALLGLAAVVIAAFVVLGNGRTIGTDDLADVNRDQVALDGSPEDSATAVVDSADSALVVELDGNESENPDKTGEESTAGSFSTANGPIRAAFLYPWFPNAWSQGGVEPFTNFSPSFGRYSSSDAALISRQLSLATEAHIDAFISSWWGRGHHTDRALSALLDTTAAEDSPNPSMKWGLYYEPEGNSDPSVSELVADLEYLAGSYFDHPAYLHVDGRPVVFVWAESADGAGMVQRWAEAKQRLDEDLFVVLKVFSGFEDYADQADSWHQYGPAKAYSDHLPYSATVSPGFWLVGESPRLDRDLARFRDDVARMNASGAFWQLVTTWNEWGEGTAIEPSDEFGRAYIDVLAANPTTRDDAVATGGADEPDSAAGENVGPGSSTPVRFTAGGDHGANSNSDASFSAIAALNPRFHLALGDLKYDDTETEAEWCDFVKGHLGNTPVQLVVGNHEDDDRPDGYIGEFVKCLPDRMNSTGTYGAEYYFDVDGLVRVIMIGAGNDVAGVDYDYDQGTSHYRWLASAIDEAGARGIPWVVVGVHKVCITAGKKPCEIGTDVIDLLIEKKVDLVMHGHEHNYQRSKQVSCVEVDRYRPECVVDDGSDGVYQQGAGLVWAVAGNFGGSGAYEINRSDPEYDYLAESLGGNDADWGRGFLAVSASTDSLTVDFVGTSTSYQDRFVIAR